MPADDGAAASTAAAAGAAPVAAVAPLRWAIVCLFWLAGSVICAVLGALHWHGVESVRGFWLVFLPFPACLLYGLYRYRLQTREERAAKPKTD